MTEPAWMLSGVEPRSSRMRLVALRTGTSRLNVHQSSNESKRRSMYFCHCCLRCSRYLVLCYWHVDFECRPGHCVFPQYIFHYTKTHFLVFTALAWRTQSPLKSIPISRQRELKSETNASRTACRWEGGEGRVVRLVHSLFKLLIRKLILFLSMIPFRLNIDRCFGERLLCFSNADTAVK
jgi:hypothetical protein